MPITTWEDGIFGMLPRTEWLNIGRTIEVPNDPILSLFTDEQTTDIKAKWRTIADSYNLPVMAYYHAFDTEAATSPRYPIDVHQIEKGLIKVKRNQSERLREILGENAPFDEMLQAVLNDGIQLAEEVNTRTRVMKAEVLATGKATIKENDLDLTIDYGVPASQTSLTLDLTGDIAGQLEEIVTTAQSNGTILNGFITSAANISAMRKNSSLQKIINGNAGEGALIRNGIFREFLSSEFGLTNIITDDLIYNTHSGYGSDGRPVYNNHRFYPSNKITFFSANPAGKLGAGLWGTPPEVKTKGLLDNVTGSGVNPYIYLTQWCTEDPCETWTKASTVFMPILFNPSGLYIATTST